MDGTAEKGPRDGRGKCVGFGGWYVEMCVGVLGVRGRDRCVVVGLGDVGRR